jgi:hypothetical protein
MSRSGIADFVRTLTVSSRVRIVWRIVMLGASSPSTTEYNERREAYLGYLASTPALSFATKAQWSIPFFLLFDVVEKIALLYSDQSKATAVAALLREQWRKGEVDVSLALRQIFLPGGSGAPARDSKSRNKHPKGRKPKSPHAILGADKPTGKPGEKQCRFCKKYATLPQPGDWTLNRCA